jgi:hypothetical protein
MLVDSCGNNDHGGRDIIGDWLIIVRHTSPKKELYDHNRRDRIKISIILYLQSR